MVQHFLKVVQAFDPDKDYEIKIRLQYVKCLSVLKKGETINPRKFIEENQDKFTKGKRSFKSNSQLVYHAFWYGKKIGMLKELSHEDSGVPISYENFCKLESVSYFISQLRKSRYRNVDPGKATGTRHAYAYRLWSFNNWLHGKTFEFTHEIQIKKDTYKRGTESIQLNGVEDLLKLYQQPFKLDAEFAKIVKMYLMDPKHKSKRAKTIKVDCNAIRSYFEKNDTPLVFKFNYNASYLSTSGEDEQSSLSLNDLMSLLTVGKPSLVQKAVFLCKLHRGLDSSTLIDRFNFQAWEQMVKHFGTTSYKNWDLSKCPVPIMLTRMKTDYTHTGFLDLDAVETIQKYLDFRHERTQSDMKNGDALFLNDKNEPIKLTWINFSLRKLAKNAGLEKILPGYKQNRYKINPHEFRDLLKSTLLDCGVRPDLAEHFIGHKPKDSYEKQALLYPESLKKEYSKASKRLNVFSNFSNFVKGAQDMDEMRDEIAKMKKRIGWSDKARRKNNSK